MLLVGGGGGGGGGGRQEGVRSVGCALKREVEYEELEEDVAGLVVFYVCRCFVLVVYLYIDIPSQSSRKSHRSLVVGVVLTWCLEIE